MPERSHALERGVICRSLEELLAATERVIEQAGSVGAILVFPSGRDLAFPT